MKVARIESTGTADVIRIVELETPEPGQGQVRIRIEAAGVNFVDIYQRRGVYAIPAAALAAGVVLGSEGAGTIEALGPGAHEFAVGARVAWSSVAGSYATHVIANESQLVPIPEGVDAKRAAAVMLQGMTAEYLVRSTYPLQKGETCIVHAAAGGVGLLLCQLARAIGAYVIGTVGSDVKEGLAREAGAHDVIRYRDVDFAVEARRLTKGEGVHVVYDSVGKDTFEKSIASLRRRGMLVSFGQSSGVVPPFAPLLLADHGSLYVTRPKLNDYTATRVELLARAADVLENVRRNDLRVRIHEALPLDRAADAHRLLEGRSTTGKLLLVP